MTIIAHEEVGVDDIFDVCEAALLGTISIYFDGFMVDDIADENGDNAAIDGVILVRSVDMEVAEDRVVKVMVFFEGMEILFSS